HGGPSATTGGGAPSLVYSGGTSFSAAFTPRRFNAAASPRNAACFCSLFKSGACRYLARPGASLGSPTMISSMRLLSWSPPFGNALKASRIAGLGVTSSCAGLKAACDGGVEPAFCANPGGICATSIATLQATLIEILGSRNICPSPYLTPG